MTAVQANTRVLWERYRSTRSNEYHTALVEHYMPVVQMQMALWVYGLKAGVAESTGRRAYDRLAEPADGRLFLPFVPPEFGSAHESNWGHG